MTSKHKSEDYKKTAVEYFIIQIEKMILRELNK